MNRSRLFALLLAAGLAACGGARSAPLVPQEAALREAAHPSIDHIVIVVQENRSFTNLFSGFPGADAPTVGYSGKTKITLAPVGFENPNIIENRYRDAIAGYANGKMNGFNGEHFYGANFPYSYVPQSETGPYWAMAKHWVLLDRMFPTEFGASFTAHLALISSNTEINNGGLDEVDYPTSLPWSCQASPGTTTFTLDHDKVEHPYGPYPCFSGILTLAEVLDAGHVTWRYYAPSVADGISNAVWTEFGAISNIYNGPDWKNVITPDTRVFADIDSGHLPNVSWVIPDWANSDHPGSDSTTGPSWVSAVVNAVGKSRYWNSTAIVVLWDDWGGWYDDVPPPQLDFRGLGIRVPCIIISPYARSGSKGGGYISHTQYEYGSIIRFVEDVFHLPVIGPASEGYTDTRATSLSEEFDLTQKARPFAPIRATYDEAFFLRQKPSLRAPDDY